MLNYIPINRDAKNANIKCKLECKLKKINGKILIIQNFKYSI